MVDLACRLNRLAIDHLSVFLDLFVSGLLLRDHGDRLLNRKRLGLKGLLHHRLDAKDVTRELVAELDALSLHAEECRVATLTNRSFALDRNFEGFTSGHSSVQGHNLGLDVITRSLNELGSCRPGCVSVVAHPPGLAENISTNNLVLVGEALLDEAG